MLFYLRVISQARVPAMKSSKNFLYRNSRRVLRAKELLDVYRTLRKAFGHQHWWPGDTPFEIVVGAILTQNTSWTNVERAIRNLKRAKKLSPQALYEISQAELAELIRPAGYFNVKAKRLKNFMIFLFKEFGGSLGKMFPMKLDRLREMLLSVNGIGPETADSILLYAGEKPIFVVDAYTKRIFSRHRFQVGPRAKGLYHEPELYKFDYSDWQKAFMKAIPKGVSLYNDFHAQIVHLGKHFCRSQKALCESCPLAQYL